MKTFIFATISLLTLAAYPQTTPDFMHSWFCMADGIEPASGRKMQVSGENRPVLEQAQRSAVITCQALGLMACTASTCIDEGGSGFENHQDSAE